LCATYAERQKNAAGAKEEVIFSKPFGISDMLVVFTKKGSWIYAENL